MALQSLQNRRVVRYDYQANDREELDIIKDETLTVLDSSGLWWKVKNDKGTVGLIPSNYLWGLGDGPAPSPAPGQKAEEPPHVYHQPADVVMVNHSNGPSLNIAARAKYRYQGTREDELSLEKGDELIVMEKEADGWWKGRCGTKIGWFPFNYVEEVASSAPSDGGRPAAATSVPPKEKNFICGVIALYSFSSGNPEELAFQKGDLLDIIDQPADDPDWWEARKADGTKGLIPRNYVEIVHNAEPVFGSEGGIRGQLMKPSLPPTSSISSSSYPPPPFAHEVWYHGKVARKDAENILNMRAENGQFIVRSSETKVTEERIDCNCESQNWPIDFLFPNGVEAWLGTNFSYMYILGARCLPCCVDYSRTERLAANYSCMYVWLSLLNSLSLSPSLPPFLPLSPSLLPSFSPSSSLQSMQSTQKQPGDYSISMKTPERIKHFNVKNLADGRLDIHQQKFDSMDQLIQHYRRVPLFSTTTHGKMYLTEGLPKGPH